MIVLQGKALRTANQGGANSHAGGGRGKMWFRGEGEQGGLGGICPTPSLYVKKALQVTIE
jgi:hypothetical protein